MGRTTQFLEEVETAIGRSIPIERRDEVLAETYAHLEDRAEDLAFGGAMSQEKAEEEALSAFGNARKYAHRVAESFYEDVPRRKVRKLAFWSALICCTFSMLTTKTIFHNPWYQEVLIYDPGSMLYRQDVVLGVTLSLVCSLCLGFLGRKRQTRKISVVFLGLLAACFVYLGMRDALSDDRLHFYQRSQLRSMVALEPRQKSVSSYLRENRLAPLMEAHRVFTSPEPIPAQWKLSDGTFPIPAPKTEKWPELTLSRFRGKLSSSYAVRSEQEARRRWREDGDRVLHAMRVHIQHAEASHARFVKTWQAMLAKPFHPMAAFVQVVDSIAIWLLVILCDALGAALGRWVHRLNWKKKPSLPQKGATA